MNRFCWRLPKVVLAVLLASGAWMLSAPATAQENAQTGVAEGIVTAKGEAWIAVRPDGERESVRLMPRWVGGLPKMGGGLDKRMLAIFQQLQVGTRVKFTWLNDEHLRVLELQVLPPKKEDGKESESAAKPKSGVTTGVVTAKGENWISIRADGQEESTKLIPRWVGGLPKDGGGFDKQMLQLIAQTPVGAHVRVEWVFQEHLRVVALRRAE